MDNISTLKKIAQRIRHTIITSTTEAGSGHPTSSLSGVELTAVLFFGGFFRQDISDFQNPLNDKFILSKGHAAPLLYSLYEAGGVLSHDEMLTLRKFNSRLQGHPTPQVPFVDVTTGSLGQGLSVGVGMALGLQKKFQVSSFKFQTPKVFVLLGDSEFAEGQNYEAVQIATTYKLDNLIAILDVNSLGQRGETQLGWDLETYKKRMEVFGWNTVVIHDGHDIEEIQKSYSSILTNSTNSTNLTNSENLRPTMFIAKTIKGKGVSFMENVDSWHGKPIPQTQLEQVLKEIGEVDFSVMGIITKPDSPLFQDDSILESIKDKIHQASPDRNKLQATSFKFQEKCSTREAYGYALADLAKQNKNILALDAETSNSTYAEFVKKETPDQFIECFIAEQNMISMALGLSKIGYIPFASSFGAFLTRAFDQIRMAQYSVESVEAVGAGLTNSTSSTLNIVGSHVGCSIGVDGVSQMALEDIAMMRSIRNSTVLYPSDGTSTYKLVRTMAGHPGINYLRITREKLPLLYNQDEEFPIEGCKIHHCHENYPIENYRLDPRLHGDDKQSINNKYTAIIIAAGITLHEALKAQKILEEKKIHTIVVDLYSVKPLDTQTLKQLALQTNHIIVVEDHYEAGGIGEAVLAALSIQKINHFLFTHLCVRKEPRSGNLDELLHYEEIDSFAILSALSYY